MPAEVWADLAPPYATIVADPPWLNREPRATKADARRHYPTMTLGDICDLPVVDLAARDAHLWLWSTNAVMGDAYEVVEAWGFKPITVVTWCKAGPGVGYYLRNNTEHAILASRGRPMTPAKKPLSTWYRWPKAGHSVKPAGFLDLVETISPGPYIELFARQPRLGWHYWGRGYELPAEVTT